jgi:hypothetical protein
MKKIFAILAIFTVFLFWACHLTSEEGPTVIKVEGDAAWLTYDSLKIVLQDTNGNELDILFDDKLLSLNQLKTLSGKKYEGGEVVFFIQGFHGDTLVFEQNRKYSEKSGLAVVETTLVLGMPLKDLSLAPDSLKLYLGGEEGLLKVNGSPIFAKPELIWKVTGDLVDLIVKAGVWQATVKPKKEGVATVTVFPKSDTALQKKLQVQIVKDAPVLMVTPAKVFITPGSKVDFILKSTQAYGSIVDYRWKFAGHMGWDDSLSGNWKDKETLLPKQTIPFNDAGVFKIDFHVKDSEGNESEISAMVDVGSRRPSVELYPKDTIISIKDTVLFRGTIVEPGGKLASYTWDFNGDGKSEDSASLTDSSTSLNVSRIFPDSGVYQVKLRARDALGMLGEDSVIVRVERDIPVVNVGQDTAGKSREPISFHGLATQKFGRIVIYKWDYQGDGVYDDSSSTPLVKYHAYPLEGVFKARFYVRDDDGNVTIGIRNITIDDAPFLILSKHADTTISIKDSIVLTASIRNDDAKDLQYGWDFNGDGKLDDSSSTSLTKISIATGHRYLIAGNYRTILRVRDLADSVLRDTILVHVELDPPTANLGADTTVLVGTALKVKLLGVDKFGPIATRELEIGNSGLFIPISQQETTLTVPVTKGQYRIIGRVTDDDGQIGKDTLLIKVIYSPENRLANIFLSPPGTVLLPIFSPDSMIYNATVATTLANVVVGGVAQDKYASVTVNGSLLSPSTTSVAVDLVFGMNAIPIVVTAQDSSTRTYILNFKRLTSTNANLSSLSTTALAPLNPVFDPANLVYEDTVLYAVTAVTITPKAQDAYATVAVAGSLITPSEPTASIKLNVGLNSIPIIVTAQDQSTKTYTLNLVRLLKSSNNALVSLVPSIGALSPVFSASVQAYTLTVADDIDALQGTATLANDQATMTFGGSTVLSGALSPKATLAIGLNTIPIVVTAQDGATRTYTITVKRLGWIPTGVKSFSPARTVFQSIIEDKGNLYAAFIDSANSNRPLVMKKGSAEATWSTLPSNTVLEGPATNIKLMKHKDELYMGFNAPGGGNYSAVYIKKYVTGSWVAIGSPYTIGPVGSDIFTMAFDTKDSMYFSLPIYYSTKNTSLFKFNGTNWIYTLAQTASIDSATYTTMAINPASGTTYFAWAKVNYTAGSIPTAFIDTLGKTKPTYVGADTIIKPVFLPLGTAGWAVAPVPISFTLDPAGIPYYVYADAIGKKIAVKKYTGSLWVDVGIQGFSDGEATNFQISFHGSTPLVAYKDATLKTVVVKTWNGVTWVSVGLPSILSGDVSSVDLATSGTSTWVGFGEKANGNRGTVMERIVP